MDLRKYLSLLALTLCALVAFQSTPTEACMCMPAHPQSQYCSADYAVVVRVLRKANKLVAGKMVYKVDVKKTYKMTSAGRQTMKNGRIVTAAMDSLCGINLEIGRLYTIAGKGKDLDICQYFKEYQKMTATERHGFAGAYRKGCKCSIKLCSGSKCSHSMSSCQWKPMDECQTQNSACVRTTYRTPEGPISQCHWRMSPAYRRCLFEAASQADERDIDHDP